MVDTDVNNGVEIPFANYNYSFSDYFQRYKNLCLSISETFDVKKIRRSISSFVYDFDYGIPEKSRKRYFREALRDIKKELDGDKEFKQMISKIDLPFSTEIRLYKKYYYYLLKYLQILSEFAEELTSTFMPNTNIQKKLLNFSNNQFFYDKLTEYKRIVQDNLSEFSILEFRKCYNGMITFYFAYKLFVVTKDQVLVENILENILSQFLNEDVLRRLARYGDFSKSDREFISELEDELHEGMLYSNSLMNNSFSNYRILPKLQEKKYVDMTLI